MTTLYASSEGQLETLQYAYEEGCDLGDHEIFLFAAKHGHVHVLNFLRERTFFGQEAWEHCVMGVMKERHEGVVEFVKKVRGTPEDEEVISVVFGDIAEFENYSDTHAESDLDDNFYFYCTGAGRLDILKRAREKNWLSEIPPDLFMMAFFGNRMEVVDWLREEAEEPSDSMLSLAAGSGSFERFKMLLEGGAEWKKEAATIAAMSGSIDILEVSVSS
jgi:hypothetical protein